MKRVNKRGQQSRALTRMDVLILLAVLGLALMGFLWMLSSQGSLHSRRHNHRIHCANNLKSIALATKIFLQDNNNEYPWTLPTAQGGGKEFGEVWKVWGVMSNDLANPRILKCPEDASKKLASDWGGSASGFQALKNEAVSYTLFLEAYDHLPASILSSDWQIKSSAEGVKVGAFTNASLLKRNDFSIKWQADSHLNGTRGNVLVSDGHAETGLTSVQLRTLISRQSNDLHLVKPL